MTVLSNLQKKQAPGDAVPASCLHCGSPCRNVESSYCCAGCEFVYRTIHSLGLSGFYRLRESGEKARASEIRPEKKFEYLDEPTVIASMVSSGTDGDCMVRFYLPTIHCAACVWLLEKLPQVLHGVSTARVSFRSGIIEVGYRPSEIRLSELARVLNSIGYPPVPATHDATEAQLQKEDRAMLRRIGVAAVCATNTMMLADSLVQGGVTGIDEPYRQLLTWTSAAFALPAVVYSALPFYRAAFGAIIMGSLHIDIPISIAIVVSYAAGIYHALQGDSLVYFDSIACLIFLLLLARFAQQRALHKARASTLSAWDLFPGTVRVQSAQDFTEKPFRELKVGDVVEVRANERIPSDGIVVSGISMVEASFLNGESLPQEVRAGMAVLGASVNIERPILVRIEALGERTRLGQILSKVELARDKRSPLESRIQRIANVFVAATLVAAGATGLIWYWIEPARAFDIVIAFLVVTCPCALGLAIPTAVTVALSRAQKNGIFIKKSEALQTLAEAQHFYFDKTGTLTEGRLRVKNMVGTESQRSLAVALARVAATHPVSRAILEFGSEEAPPVVRNSTAVPARGVQVELEDGRKASLGSYKWSFERQVHFPAELARQVGEFQAQGESICVLDIDGSATLLFSLQDSVRPEALHIVSQLRAQGKSVFILSGDSQAVVDRVAQELSIPKSHAKGELYPEEKMRVIELDPAITVMVGDGLNDAPAIAAGSVGVGVSGGIEATLEVADIFVSDQGLRGFWRAYEGACSTRLVVKRNLMYSIVYNILGASLACLGYITPLIAALIMPISSCTVILSSIAGSSFKSRGGE